MNKKIIAVVEKYWIIFVVSAGFIAACLALSLSVGQSVWFDEGYSILIAQEPVGELLSLTAVDAHPPFYYLLLKLWGEIFGFSELTLRSLSAVAAGAAVTMALILIRRLFGTRVALMAVPILILAPFALRYGYEIRMYAVAALISIAATYALVRAYEETGKKTWWVFYAVLVALGMYTLYMTLAVWLAHFAWLVWMSLRDKKLKQQPIWQWQWPYVYVGAVVLFVPYMPTFFYQLQHSALPGIGKQVTLTSVVDITTMTSLYTAEWAMNGWLSLILAVIAVAVIAMMVRLRKYISGTQLTGFVLLLTLVVVPVMFFAVSSLPPRPPVYVVRYVAHIALFMSMIIAVTIGLYWVHSKNRQSITMAVYVSVLALLSLGVINLSRTGNFNFERMQQPYTTELRSMVQCADDTVIVADDPYTFIDSVYYYDQCDIRFYSQDNVARAGGYAMLHNSDKRVSVSDEVSSHRLVHLRWVGENYKFVPDNRYRLVSASSLDKQVVEIYELIEE